MTLAMNARLTFSDHLLNEFVITKVSSISIESSWRMLTDTATIVLPRNVSDFDKQRVKDVFKVGHCVCIELGYNGAYNTEFKGYITRVSAEVPIVLECQDEMWRLKQMPVNISLKSAKLIDLLKKIAPKYPIKAIDIDLSAQRHPKTTVAKVLEYLKQEYNLYSYMQNGVLVCNLKSDNGVSLIPIHLEKSVVNNSLVYRTLDEKKVKINIVSILKNGNKVEVSEGDDDGETIQKTYYGISSKTELKKIANAEYIRHKIDGFEGSVETFGNPFIKHGDRVSLFSDLYNDRNGVYLTETVKTVFNDSPQYHRTVTLGEAIL